jgi:hypothetical protein
MIKNTLQTIGLAALLAGLSHVTAAPYIVQPVAVVASSVYGGTSLPGFTIDGSGWADLYWTLPTGASIPAVWPGHNPHNIGVSWHAESAPASPLTITFDLGTNYHLTGMHLWNMNQGGVPGRSIKTAIVSVSGDGTHFTDVSVGGLNSNGYFLQAPGAEGYRGDDYTFAAEAKWVRFSITSDWYGNLEYAGLSEVRFIATTTPAVTFTTNATIAVNDLTHDGQDLVVNNCTLMVDGAHGFNSLLLTNGAVLTHSPAANGEPDNRLDLTITNNLTVDATSRVDVNAKGYGTTNGPGKGVYDFSYPSSGGHGGPGGDNYNHTLAGGGTYDSVLAPTQWGSGGGEMGFSVQPGGAGGGVIRLQVGGVLTVAGQLRADGESTYDSGGAGGSVYLTVGTLAGGGTVLAKGGDASYVLSGGGGGGRIAIYYGSSVFSGVISAAGGLGGSHASAHCGGAGTLYTKANSQNVGDLLLDNTGRTNAMETPITTPVAYRLTLTNVTAYATNPLSLSGLRVSTNGLLTHPYQGPRLQVLVQGNAVVENGGVIGADTRGYPLKTGSGAGAGSGGMWGTPGSGAGHGGQGGAGYYAGPGGLPYGSETEPMDFGSGGGGNNEAGPNRGGGAIQLTVEGTLTIDGRISVNADAVAGSYDGGGSGGSVWLTASRLNGDGSIIANGQAAYYAYAGAGAGGRIVIDTGANQFAGLVQAGGGTGGYQSGGNGTVHYGTNIPSSLVSWWPAENSGEDFAGPNNATPSGAVGYAPGVNQAFDLDGVSAYLQVMSPAGLPLGNHPRTLMLWFKTPRDLAVNTESALIQYGTPANGQMFGLITSLNAAGKLYFYGHNQDLASTIALGRNVWYHAAAAYDGTTVTLYLNGEPSGSQALALNTALNPDGLTIGYRPGGAKWQGQLDEVMLFNRALTANEIAAIYTTGTNKIVLPPTLAISLTGGGVLLSWPANAASVGLVSRTNLAAGIWESVINAPSLNGDRKEVLLPAHTPVHRFFRLQIISGP